MPGRGTEHEPCCIGHHVACTALRLLHCFTHAGNGAHASASGPTHVVPGYNNNLPFHKGACPLHPFLARVRDTKPKDLQDFLDVNEPSVGRNSGTGGVGAGAAFMMAAGIKVRAAARQANTCTLDACQRLVGSFFIIPHCGAPHSMCVIQLSSRCVERQAFTLDTTAAAVNRGCR